MDEIVVVFGHWDAPVTDGAERLMVPPEDMKCMHCGEHFKADDNGAIFPSGFAAHRECHLRGVVGGIGHLVNHARYCHDPERGTDGGLTRRQSSWLVWRHWWGEHVVTEQELDMLYKLEKAHRDRQD